MHKIIYMQIKIPSNLNKISKDIIFNIIANLIPVAVLQLIVLPYIANELGDEKNGQFLTVLALLHFIVPITSNSLSTARLLLNQKYQEDKITGDFNLWLSLYAVLNIGLVVIGCLFYFNKINTIDIISICLLSVVWMIKDYLLVEFRLFLTYSKILINNLFLTLGLLIGAYLFNFFSHWYIIFICGYSVAFMHAVLSTSLLREPFGKTEKFKHLSNVIIKLVAANILGMLAVNMDRLLLFPLAGGAIVSIYFSASIIGKIVTLISSPISNVFLSYFVRIKQLTMKNLYGLLILSGILGIMAYGVILLISPLLLRLLYPQWWAESLKYIYITSGISSIELIVALTTPLLLRFNGVNMQMKIQTIYFLLYAVCGLLLYFWGGLKGFAFGVMLATMSKMCLTCYYLIRKIRILNITENS